MNYFSVEQMLGSSHFAQKHAKFRHQTFVGKFRSRKISSINIFLKTCISFWKRTDKNASPCTREQHWHTSKHLYVETGLYEFGSALFVQILYYFCFTTQLVFATCLYSKSKEPCIWHIKNYHKCMIFYEELRALCLSVLRMHFKRVCMLNPDTFNVTSE